MKLRIAGAESNRRSGFTLLEMVTVFGVLTICMLLGAVLIITTMKTERLAETAGNQVSVRKELARQFREDVSRAEAAPDKLGDAAAGPNQLILRLPGETVILYRWEKNKLERRERIQAKDTWRPVAVGPDGTSVEFVRPQAGGGLITMRLTQTPERGLPKKSEISTALGRSLK